MPSTSIFESFGALNAVCKTDLFSVLFILKPLKYFEIEEFNFISSAKALRSESVSVVILFLE